MKILLVHPEDSPCTGPWVGKKWDLVIDLGKASTTARDFWQERLDLPILTLESFRGENQHFVSFKKLLNLGRHHLVDELGLDWWDLINVRIFKPLEESLLLERLADELSPTAELYATRPGWPASGIGLLLGRPVRALASAFRSSPFLHYGDVLKRFSLDQLAQIFLDKYDPRYRWRSKVISPRRGPKGPLVLLPTAYTNVSRMAVTYAGMLPEQTFLVVATRRSGTHFDPIPNVTCTDLAAYSRGPESHAEFMELLAKWKKLKERLALSPPMDLLLRAGLLEKVPDYLRDGLAVRNSWRNVLYQEQIVTVMCGDDSNPYTRLPVLLSRQLGIPTLDFHHGALDGRFFIKELSSDLYLAKGEMEKDYLVRVCGLPAERVVVAGPARRLTPSRYEETNDKSQIVFFSEPYESGGWRTEEVYRDLLPPLARHARENARQLVVKLHPFESLPERIELIAKVLGKEAAEVEVFAGPFTPQLVARAWFAVTVESTTVIDCALLGVPCFLCEWLSSSPYGYTRQYARFGVGRALRSAEELGDLPRRLTESTVSLSTDCLLKPMDPAWLREVIAKGTHRTQAASPKTT